MARDKCKIHPCVSYGYEKIGYFNAEQLENLSNSQGKGCHHTSISTLQLQKKTNFSTLSHSITLFPTFSLTLGHFSVACLK